MAGRRRREPDRRENFSILECREKGGLVERPGSHLARAAGTLQYVVGVQRLHKRRHVVAGIPVGDITADGAEIADLRIGDLQGRFRLAP